MTIVALGLIVNPKLARPVLATWDGAEVDICALDDADWSVIGTGYYGDSDDAAARATGMPRSHTPSGVAIKKRGYGTCLYTALCLGAHMNAEGALKLFRYGPDGDGISSNAEDRSSEANDWWDRAKDVGLATEVSDDQTEESVDVTSDLSDTVQGSEVDGKLVTYVNTINVDLEASVTVDVYPWDRAAKHNLLIAEFSAPVPLGHPEVLWKTIQGTEELEVIVEPEWILGLDVRGLSVSAMNLLGLLGEVAGATDEDLHALRFRWEHNLDPAEPVKQMRLPFKANSDEARRADAAVRQAAEFRRASGWNSLADLP
jgi:hypothetical protein